MLPEIDVWMRWASTTMALAGLFSWLGGDHGEGDDDDTAECHEAVMDAVSDADNVRTIDCVTGHNLRDQLSIDEAMQLHDEQELRGWHGRRN